MKNKLALILSLLLLTACTSSARIDTAAESGSFNSNNRGICAVTTDRKALLLSSTVQAVLFTSPTPEIPPAILMPKAQLTTNTPLKPYAAALSLWKIARLFPQTPSLTYLLLRPKAHPAPTVPTTALWEMLTVTESTKYS